MRTSQLIIAAMFGLAVSSAQALTVSSTQAQTQDGGIYNFVFSGLSTSTSSGGSITFSARGDYSFTYSGPSNPIEVLTGSAEGLNFGVMGVDNASTTTAFSFDDNFWSKTFLLSTTDILSLITDGVLNVSVSLDSNVDLFNPGTAYVGIDFTYTPSQSVPEPGSLLLIGGALAALGAARRRK